MAEEINEEYLSSLSDLTFNSKPLINMLTILADENVGYAPAIVNTIEKHIEKVPAENKLPILYLIDSIVKNINNKTYRDLFATRIVSIFVNVFEKVDEKTKGHMYKLRQTWGEVFPIKKLFALDIRVKELDPAWPVTATPSSIHVNPKFLAKKQQKTSPPPGEKKEEDEGRSSRDKMLHRQMLRELEQKKMELERLEAKIEMKKAQNTSANINQDIVKIMNLQSVLKPQAVILPPSSSKQSSSNGSYSGQRIKIAPANPEIIQSVRLRDPRITRKIVPAQPSLKEQEIITHQLAMLKSPVMSHVVSTLPVSSAVIPVISSSTVTSRRTEKENKRVEHSKKSSIKHSSDVEKRSSKRSDKKHSDSNKSPQKSRKSSPSPTLSSHSPAKKHSPSKHKEERASSKLSKRIKSPKDKDKEHASKIKVIVEKIERKKSKKEKFESESKKKKTKLEKEIVVENDKVAAEKKEMINVEDKVEKKVKEDVKDKEEVVMVEEEVEIVVTAPSPEPPPPPTITNDDMDIEETVSEDEDEDVNKTRVEQMTGFKDTKGKTKNRPYMRRNRQESLSPTMIENDNNITENLVNVSGKDVDLRQLRISSPSKKRLPNDTTNEPPKKKNKQRMFDSLFGSEDVDLRQMPPQQQQLLPSPPPPPVISTPPPQSASAQSTVVTDVPTSASTVTSDTTHTETTTEASSEVDNDGQTWAQVKKTGPLEESMDMEMPIISTTGSQLDRLGRPLLYNRLPNDPRQRRESLNVIQSDTDMRRQPVLLSDNLNSDVNVNMIIQQTEEQLRNGTLSSDERNHVLSQVVQLNEFRKLREAQRQDNRRRGGQRRRNRRSPVHSEDEDDEVVVEDDDRSFRDVDERRGRRRVGRNQNYPRSYRKRDYDKRQQFVASPPPLTSLYQTITPRYENPAQDLPPADPHLLNVIAQDAVKSIRIDGTFYDIRYYAETAVIFFSDNEPKEISFHDGESVVMISDLSLTLYFNGGHQNFKLGDKIHSLKLGGPTREFYIDGQHHSGNFGGPPTTVRIDGVNYLVALQSPPPQVRVGELRRDLVAGRVNLIVNAKEKVSVYLDSKPQVFVIDDHPIILRFINSLTGVLLNETPVDLQFNGLPKAINVNGRRHYVRLSSLPDGVVPGVSTVPIIELDQQNSNESFPPRISVKPHHMLSDMTAQFNNDLTPPTVTHNATPQGSLDYLTSLMPASSTPEQAGGFGYQLDETGQQLQPKPATPILNALQNVNIDVLFQGLVASGILPNANTKPQFKETDDRVFLVDLNDPHSMRQRQPAVVNSLYTGIQCNTCGVRFKPEDTLKYSHHLDWHFRQNRRDKDSLKKAQSRKWYYDVSDWIQFEEFENLDDRAQSWFETEATANQATEETVEEVIPCVAAPAGSVVTTCDVCNDKFELFFNEDNEEWQLRNCVVADDKYYHPQCYEDIMQETMEVSQEPSGDDSVAVIIVEVEENSDKPSDEPVGDKLVDDDEIMELPKEDAVNEEIILDDSIEEQVDEDEDVVVSFIVDKLVTGVVDNEKRQRREAEEMRLRQERELEELGFTSIPVEPKKKISDEEFYERVDDEIQLHYDPPDNYVPIVKIKQEPIDEMEAVASGVDQTLVNVVSSIDGNVELTDTPPIAPAAPSKIKINLNKPIILETNNDNNKINKEVVITTTEEREPEQLLPLKPRKPGLANRELTVYPSVERGREMSGLCSIM